MADEPIGSVRVDVVADYSQLSNGLKQAQQQAQQAGNAIASALSSSAGPSATLTTGITQLAQAVANLNATVSQYSGFAASANQSIQQTTGVTSQAAGATQQLGAAQQQTAVSAAQLQQAVAALQQTITQQAAATSLAIQRNLALGQSMQTAGSGASSATSGFVGLYAAVSVLHRAFSALDNIRQSEVDLLHLSEATGISAQRIAAFEDAVGRAGGNGEKFGTAIVFLSRSIEQGQRGVKTMSDELARLGVTSRDPIEAFLQIADTIHNTADKSEALAAASRVLGRGQQDLIGIMSGGSAALRAYMGEMQGLAKAQADGIDSSVTLTRVQNDLKAAVLEVALAGMPVLVEAMKVVGTAFSVVNIAVKAFSQVLMHAFEGGIQAAKDFATVMSDLAGRKWELAKIDAKLMLDDARKEFADFSKDVTRETKDSVDFIQKLWGEAAPKGTLGAGKAFPAPATKVDKGPEQELRKQFENEFAELQKDHQVTIAEEQTFWNERFSIVQAKGAAFADLASEINRKLGELNQRALREQAQEIKRGSEEYVRQVEETIKNAQNAATEAGGHPAAVKLQLLQENEAVSTGDVAAKLRAQIPEAVREAGREATTELKRLVNQNDRTWEEAGTRSAAAIKERAEQTRATLESLRGLFPGIDALIDEQTARILAANRRLRDEAVKVGDLEAKGAGESAQTDIQAQKIAAQQEYASLVDATFEQQIAYQRQIAALDEQIMALKRDEALAEFDVAAANGDVVKAEQAALAWLKEDDAIRLHRLETESKIAQLQGQASLQRRIEVSFDQNIAQAGQHLADAFGQSVASGKGIGQVFEKSLKQLEGGAISGVLGNAIKQALNFQPIHDALQKLATVMSTLISAVLTHAGTMLAHLAVMTAHLAVMGAHLAVMLANTIATLANTVATIANTIVQAVKGVLGLFGLAGGGRANAGQPYIVGEQGPELMWPDSAGTVIPAKATAQILGSLAGAPSLSVAMPEAPRNLSGPGAGGSSSQVWNSANTVTNQSTGGIGSIHFHLTDSRNPRENVRQIAGYLKSTYPYGSPFNNKS